MGLATAKIVGRDHTVVLCRRQAGPAGRRGRRAEGPRDHGDGRQLRRHRPAAVDRLFETAAGLGTVASVIHTAGVSPSMGDADYVMRTNAVGTLNVNEVFYGDRRRGRPRSSTWHRWRPTCCRRS